MFKVINTKGKTLKTFDSYDEAWAYARNRGNRCLCYKAPAGPPKPDRRILRYKPSEK